MITLSQIVFIGENDSVLIMHDSSQTDVILQRIRTGMWQPPSLDIRGPFEAVQKGETVIVSTRNAKETLHMRMILTATEARIIHGLAAGLTDDQIAHSVQISPRTVRFYISRLKNRLNATTREHLVAKAGLLGLYDGTSIGLEN